MFERYTERARRTIFFGHYEASRLGSTWIDTEHLLLGLLREDRSFALEFPGGAIDAIHRRVEELHTERPKASTSVDLPLSHSARRVLAYAAEEAERFHHLSIDTQHLALGILRVEGCLAGDLLREHGVDYDSYRKAVGETAAQRTEPAAEERAPVTAAPSLVDSIQALEGLVSSVTDRIDRSSASGERRLKRKSWTRRQALGHLVDWAEAHQQWLARALTEPRLDVDMYPADEWVAAQRYGEYPWSIIIGLWESLNRLLIHVMSQIPEEKVNLPCRIGVADPIPLSELISRYVAHCQDIAGQILAHL